MINMQGSQRKELRDTLVRLFPTWDDFSLLVQDGLHENLNRITAPKPIDHVAFELIEWVGRMGRTDELIVAALKAMPHDDQLQTIANSLGIVVE